MRAALPQYELQLPNNIDINIHTYLQVKIMSHAKFQYNHAIIIIFIIAFLSFFNKDCFIHRLIPGHVYLNLSSLLTF